MERERWREGRERWREREFTFELSPAQLEDRQTKMQREVVDAQQGVNFVIVSYNITTHVRTHTHCEQQFLACSQTGTN